ACAVLQAALEAVGGPWFLSDPQGRWRSLVASGGHGALRWAAGAWRGLDARRAFADRAASGAVRGPTGPLRRRDRRTWWPAARDGLQPSAGPRRVPASVGPRRVGRSVARPALALAAAIFQARRGGDPSSSLRGSATWRPSWPPEPPLLWSLPGRGSRGASSG